MSVTESMTGRHGDLDCARCRPPLPRRSALAAIIYYQTLRRLGRQKVYWDRLNARSRASAVLSAVDWGRGASVVPALCLLGLPPQLPCHCAVGAAGSAPPARSLLSAV